MSAIAARISERRVLFRSALIAIIIEGTALTSIGWHSHWLSHPQRTTGLDDSRFLEAQMVTLPPSDHLVEEKPLAAPVPKAKEPALSRVPGKGRKSKSAETLPSKNVTKAAGDTSGQPSLGPTHGPVALYNPSPVIPESLQGESLNRTVVVEFFITAQGAVTPRLLRSSGSDELDAIALETVKKWQFRPAEQEHHPIDAKVRLRILFDVH